MNKSSQSTSPLGTLRGEFRYGRRFVWGGIGISAFFLLLAASGVWLILSGSMPAAAGERISPIVWLPLTVALCAALGGLFLWKTIEMRRARVQIFENGLAYLGAAKIRTFAWDEIERFRSETTDVSVNFVPAGRRYLYVLEKADGEKLIIAHGFESMEKIGEIVSAETFRRLLPRARETIERGGEVAFGRLAAAPDGLVEGGKRLAWSEVGEIRVAAGVIHIERRAARSAWTKVAYKDMPNARVFLALAERMLTKRRNSAQ